jgi:hypothetical protein
LKVERVSFLRWTILCLALWCLLGQGTARASLKGDMLIGYGAGGWQAGLGLSQETVRTIGFFGYEKTGIIGYLSLDDNVDNVSSWIGGHKQVNVGNVGYTLEVFVANTQRPILSTFMDNVAPHVGAYGEYNRMYGEYGHGLSGTAQLYVDDDGGIDYIIQPYLQLRRGGTWRLSAQLGSSFGVGLTYLEPSETLKLDLAYREEGFTAYGLLDVPDEPMSIGAGWNGDRLQGFVRYYF